jgi:hypothetical protein
MMRRATGLAVRQGINAAAAASNEEILIDNFV